MDRLEKLLNNCKVKLSYLKKDLNEISEEIDKINLRGGKQNE